jgi:hypothetical protein
MRFNSAFKGLKVHWVRLLEEVRDVSPLYSSPATVWGRPPSYAMDSLIQFPPGVNQPESVTVFFSPSSAQVKNKRRYTSTTQYVSMTFKCTSLPLCNIPDSIILYNQNNLQGNLFCDVFFKTSSCYSIALSVTTNIASGSKLNF